MAVNGHFIYPAMDHLGSQLQKMIDISYDRPSTIESVKRRPFLYHSTSPAEIIKCSMDNGKSVSLFCKYSGNHTQFSFGHRGGVEYETKVYKNILRKSSLSLV